MRHFKWYKTFLGSFLENLDIREKSFQWCHASKTLTKFLRKTYNQLFNGDVVIVRLKASNINIIMSEK